MTKGPLAGIRIVEMAGLGPGPFCGMMLADHGAEVVTVHRPGARPLPSDPLFRSRVFVEIDLKSAAGRTDLMGHIRTADGLIEGFRPGVMERLGLGPKEVLAEHPALVYGRMTGWGQEGPMAQAPGHDINYIGLSGVLHAIGTREKPVPPLNLIGDFGGGGMLLAFAMCAALLSSRTTGQGQVIDCAMVDGASLMMSQIWGLSAYWQNARQSNPLDGAAPFYDTYACSDGKHVAVGAIEPQFYAALLRTLGLSDDATLHQTLDGRLWPTQKARLAEVFATKPRDEWMRIADSEACLTPVLDMSEAARHPHNVARKAFVQINGMTQPAPAPRFSHPLSSNADSLGG